MRRLLVLMIGACLLVCGCESGGSSEPVLDPPYTISPEMKAAIDKNLAARNHKAPRRTAR